MADEPASAKYTDEEMMLNTLYLQDRKEEYEKLKRKLIFKCHKCIEMRLLGDRMSHIVWVEMPEITSKRKIAGMPGVKFRSHQYFNDIQLKALRKQLDAIEK